MDVFFKMRNLKVGDLITIQEVTEILGIENEFYRDQVFLNSEVFKQIGLYQKKHVGHKASLTDGRGAYIWFKIIEKPFYYEESWIVEVTRFCAES